jgi:3-oxoadipate enol-lactonase
MKVRIGGAEIEYDVRGEGPGVLFLHAFPLGLSMWEAQVEALAGSHQAIRFDARGFGGSPPGAGLLTMEAIADDAVALLDRLGVSRVALVGCSMGGYAAFAFVRRHAERLRGMVHQDTRAGADSAEARSARAEVIDRVRREGASAAADAFLPKLLGETTQKENPDLVAQLRARILATAPQGIVDALAGIAARADSTPTLREIRVPTLVVCGEEDVITPPAESEAIRRGIAGSRLVLVPRAGHLANLESPAAYNAALTEFLRSLGEQLRP